MAEQEPWNRQHNRRKFEVIPELRGLPYDVAYRLYTEGLEIAKRETRWGCLTFVLAYAAMVLGLWGLAWLFRGRVQEFKVMLLVLAALAFVMLLVTNYRDYIRTLDIIRRYVQQRLPSTCVECGYDLIDDAGGGCCPECGRVIGSGPPAT